MLFCPVGVSFLAIWCHGGFNVCLFNSVKAAVLAVLMGICGVFEFRLYRKYGTPVSRALLEPVPRLYILQMLLSLALIAIQPIQLGVRSMDTLFGYGVLVDLVGLLVWVGSALLIFLERNYDLPTLPGRGHSIYLLIFWGVAIVVDTLEFVNVASPDWYFYTQTSSEVALLIIFLVQWLSELGVFILGLKAPGLVSNRQRNEFIYQPIDEPKYGSVSALSVDSAMEIGMGTGIHRSVRVVKEALANGALAERFRGVERQLQTEEVSLSVAKQKRNEPKNRYWNVLPYDHNRVRLSGGDNDYINASWIRMRIPDLDQENCYIASQGPKPETVGDLWRVVWEQRVPAIVMLTELKEGNVRKCEKYWPEPGASLEFPETHLVISGVSAVTSKWWTTREFLLVHLLTRQQASVLQLQFHSWPDHQAPKETKKLLEFWRTVRNRLPSRRPTLSDDLVASPPVLVHCSAGVGRSGAYILMETLILEMEAGVPLYPVEVVAELRRQRMAMVQTEEQFVHAVSTALLYQDQVLRRR